VIFDKAAKKRLKRHLGGDRGLRIVEPWLGVYIVISDEGPISAVTANARRTRSVRCESRRRASEPPFRSPSLGGLLWTRQVFRERTGENPAWAVNGAPPDHGRIATVEQRKGFLYIEPVLRGPCATILAGPYADLGEAMAAIGTHIGGTCALGRWGRGGVRRSHEDLPTLSH
jgi:hypothetical protein